MRFLNVQQRLNAIALLVAFTGLVTISSILFALAHFHRVHLASSDAHLTLLAGLSLIYLATVLARGKRTAWLIAVTIYCFLSLRNIRHFIFDFPSGVHYLLPALLNLALPLLTLSALIYCRRLYNVRSELRSFTTAGRRALLVLLIALIYGIVGFSFMDDRDFHQEISPVTAAHYTIDQFGLTTQSRVVAHSRRAHLFVDSLTVISLGAIFYTAVSLFSPIRFRLSNHQRDYEDIRRLMRRFSTTSEDFFMLWPRDKSFFFNSGRTAAIAYKASHGIALIVADPLGPAKDLEPLLADFLAFCRLNDWQPAFVHCQSKHLKLYQKMGFEAQKIGEEAIIDTAHFVSSVATSKDFRHIKSKFAKLGYSCHTLNPPHDAPLVVRLKAISDDWLSRPGRAERGFMLGYFSETYIQQCELVVAVDANDQIQAFINRIPSSLTTEANFDFLRHSSDSPGNINDYLMMNFIGQLHARGVPKLNMGLSPLYGLDEQADSANRLLNSFLNFAYSNGNYFFSFQGLKRFKSKYQPTWQDRYIVYRGGIRGFSKTLNALMRAMRVKRLR